MQVLSPLLPRLLFLVWNTMRVGECILSNAGYLPGHFAFRFASADLEAVACHLLDDVQVRPRRTNRSQLIAEVPIQSFEIIRQSNPNRALRVENRNPVVDVHHVRRFDKRVIEIFVGGIERVVDLERTTALAQVASDVDIAVDVDSHRRDGIALGAEVNRAGGRGGISISAVSHQRAGLTIEKAAEAESDAGKGVRAAARIADE